MVFARDLQYYFVFSWLCTWCSAGLAALCVTLANWVVHDLSLSLAGCICRPFVLFTHPVCHGNYTCFHPFPRLYLPPLQPLSTAYALQPLSSPFSVPSLSLILTKRKTKAWWFSWADKIFLHPATLQPTDGPQTARIQPTVGTQTAHRQPSSSFSAAFSTPLHLTIPNTLYSQIFLNANKLLFFSLQ